MVQKAASALRTIGEVSAQTGIPTHVLRYWERQIPGINPVRRAGGRRYYRVEDVAKLRQIHHLITAQGYTLDGAARALRSAVPVAPVAPLPPGQVDIRGLAALRDRLQRALAAG